VIKEYGKDYGGDAGYAKCIKMLESLKNEFLNR
jgi:hypothetical protein